MQILRLIGFLLAVKCCAAAVPDSVAGYVFYGSLSAGHQFSTQVIMLGADGRVNGLFSYSYLYPGPATVRNSSLSGTYSYRKVDETSAELSFSGQRYSLRFVPEYGELAGDATLIEPASSGAWFLGFRLARLPNTAALVNCSNRSFVRAGGSAFTGFVISDDSRLIGDHSRFVLVRAVGPGLKPFGLTGLLATPRLRMTRDSSTEATNEDWRTDSADAIRNTCAVVGAFPLSSSSADSAAILSVGPGSYIAEVSSANPDDSGQVLIEVYLLP